jgi:uncharacterized protein YcaQ
LNRPLTLAGVRAFTVARSLFAKTSLSDALDRFEFVQADPIRAPARAQDLTLRHRVDGYRAGDLERQYAALDIEEDFFVNYGFVTRRLHALMHPRGGLPAWSRLQCTRVDAVLDFVRTRGAAHPREVDAFFAHGTVTNYWGGQSAATTHLLNAMHHRGFLRVARRVGGVRVYAARDAEAAAPNAAERDARLDALIDAAVGLYAPLPAASLRTLAGRLRYAVPQWRGAVITAVERARRRLGHAQIDGVDWYWPAGEAPHQAVEPEGVHLLTPFDPIVWDRRRFEMLWHWRYRFEAYTPVKKRVRGYYALPLLWRDRVIGWANLAVNDKGALQAAIGYVRGSAPRDREFRKALDGELQRMELFLRPPPCS